MIYHRMDETELLLQTDLRLVPCDVDGYYLVQGLEAQSVFQVGSLKAPSSSLNIGNLMHRGVFPHNFNSGFSKKIHSEGNSRMADEDDNLRGKMFSRLFHEVYNATPHTILVFHKLLVTASLTTKSLWNLITNIFHAIRGNSRLHETPLMNIM